jgi:hypothetical protein
MTDREILAEIKKLPPAEQQALLLWLVKHARIEAAPRSRRRLAPPASVLRDIALLSEPALVKDWDRLEEDEAWSHLDQIPPV